jgi:hypothetical protein
MLGKHQSWRADLLETIATRALTPAVQRIALLEKARFSDLFRRTHLTRPTPGAIQTGTAAVGKAYEVSENQRCRGALWRGETKTALEESHSALRADFDF